MKIRFKQLAIIISLSIITLGAGFLYLRAKNKPLKLETAAVSRGDLVQTFTSGGEVTSSSLADLNFVSAGKISWVGVKEGDAVIKGQALASLDNRSFQAQFEKARADWVAAVQNLKLKEEQYQGYADVVAKDQAILSAKAAADAAWNLLQVADYSLNNAVLFSPIDGTVVSVTIHQGEYASSLSTSPAISVANLSELLFTSEVDEADIARLTEGQEVSIILDADRKATLQGSVTKIPSKSSKNSGGDTVFKVDIKITSAPEFPIRLGMSGDADFLIAKKNGVLYLPTSSLILSDSKTYVFKIEGSKAKKMEITTGFETDENIEVATGLTEGDRVANEKLDALKDGMIITPI